MDDLGNFAAPSSATAPITNAQGPGPNDSTIPGGKNRFAIIVLLPFILTAATFITSFVFQVHQSKLQNDIQQQQRRDQLDSEWRVALEQVTAKDAGNAAAEAYEISSFLDTNHKNQAFAITASLLPKIDNELTFDVILFDIVPCVTQDNQNQIIAIDTILVRDLNHIYETTRTNTQALKHLSFADFLQHPDEFIDGDKQPELLKQALTETWELDSVSDALSIVWTNRQTPDHARPRQQDLGGAIFLNHDFSGVDFRKVNDTLDVDFVGTCNIKDAQFPASITPHCE